MIIVCPTCKKKTTFENNPHRPFCSDRCKLIDLGAWAEGKHAIPSDHDPETDLDRTSEKNHVDEEND